MKKIVILWHNGGRLANQLWLFASVYAYTLEKGYKLENRCFFEYSEYFDISVNNKLIDLLFYKSYRCLKKVLPKKMFADQHKYFFRKIYRLYLKLTEKIIAKRIVYASGSENSSVCLLSPTTTTNRQIIDFEKNDQKNLYLIGWLFRNPDGLTKCHQEISSYFRPKKQIWDKVQSQINDWRSQYDCLVGVHIRQGDYLTYNDGKFYFAQEEVNNILENYLKAFKKDRSKTGFLICSDGKIETEKFPNLQIILSLENPVTDLFLLSQTDVIIGSDSTFGAWAAYFGNLPFVVFERESIDWNYYQEKGNAYFNNSKCKTVHFGN